MNYLVQYAMSFFGTPYKYGGNGHGGIDCSGLCVELLRSVGVLSKDMSAQQLYDHLLIYGASANPGPGAIAFFGKSDEAISHVGFCINKDLMVEASGGNSSVLTLEDAKEKNAYVKLRPINGRKDFLVALLPLYKLSLFGG